MIEICPPGQQQQMEYKCWATLSGHNMEIDCGNKVLGKRGYATVFEGVWGVNRRPVAVKRVFLHAEGTRQEEEALRKLDHSNVIKLFHAERHSIEVNVVPKTSSLNIIILD
jgi:hypothetical protein